jgi:hypothetical protein
VKNGYFWLLRLALLAGSTLLLVAGCGATPTQTVSPLPTPTDVVPTPTRPEQSPLPTPTTSAGEDPGSDLDTLVANLVEQAREDLRARLQIEADLITLHSVEAVQWRDSSLGCPQPGRNYLTVITPGFQIILSAQGQEYDYRTDLQQVILCVP